MNENNKNLVELNSNANLPSPYYRESVPENFEEEIHFRDYIEVIFRRKSLLMIILFFIFISTLIFSLTAEKSYKASGSIEVRQASQKVTKFEDVVKDNIRYDDQFIVTQISLLKSDALANRVIERLNLSNHPLIAGDGKDNALKYIREKAKSIIKSLIPNKDKKDFFSDEISMSEFRKKDEVMTFIKENLEIVPENDSSIIHISFTSANRQLSQGAVNVMMEEFIDWKMDQKVASSQNAREYLNRQIDRAKINLEKAEEQQNVFARQAGIVSLDSKLNSVYRQLEDVNAALGNAETELIEAKTMYEQTIIDGPSSLKQVLDNKLINDLKAEYALFRSAYENACEVFHDDFPDVKTLKNQMESINARIENESEKIFMSIQHDYEISLNRFESLQIKFEQKKQLALNLNESSTQYLIMNREVETNKEIYQSLLERAKEIESMAGISASNIQIVDKASLPIFPYKPDVKRNLILAIVLGLLAGIGGVFLVEYFADTISNPDQISERFGIPILGVIPMEKESSDSPLERIFSDNPLTAISEAFRTSKISIQLSGTISNSKCFAITSTVPGEGKTTITANLAQAFAGSGEKVMLIDADLRKPRLQNIFLDNTSENNLKGLSSLLAGVVSKGFINKTGIKNLFLISSGPLPPNPVELLSSNRFGLLIKKLSEKYDRIIIDAPPIQGLADVLVLSKQVGGVVLVSSIGETTLNGVRHFKKTMHNLKGNIIGCIVNKVNMNQRFGYGSHYQYYSYDNNHQSQKQLAKKQFSS